MIWYHFTAVKWYHITSRVSLLVMALSHWYPHIICNKHTYIQISEMSWHWRRKPRLARTRSKLVCCEAWWLRSNYAFSSINCTKGLFHSFYSDTDVFWNELCKVVSHTVGFHFVFKRVADDFSASNFVNVEKHLNCLMEITMKRLTNSRYPTKHHPLQELERKSSPWGNPSRLHRSQNH